MKQETLEELVKDFYSDESQLMERIAFKRGYTECKERMYSEEEVVELISLLKSTTEYEVLQSFRDKVEQFKKK